MAFIITDRDLRPRLTFHSSDAVSEQTETSLLNELPLSDTFRQTLSSLRRFYQDRISFDHRTRPTLVGVIRLEKYLENHAWLIPMDFPDKQQVEDYLPGGNRRLGELCRDILLSDNQVVIWEGVNPLINAEYIESKLDIDSAVIFQPHRRMLTIDDHLSMIHQLIYRRKDGSEYFEFDDPHIFYAFIAYYYEKSGSFDELLSHLKRDGLLDKNRLAQVIPALSLICENVMLKHPDNFVDFMEGLSTAIDGEEGYMVSAALVEDLWTVYQPLLERDKLRYYNLRNPGLLLTTAANRLQQDYQNWQYTNRPDFIGDEVRETALIRLRTQADPMMALYAYLESIYKDMGALVRFPQLLEPDEIESIRWIFERAQKEKKLEAGQIPVVADILGFPDREKLIWITNLTQLLWTALLTHDATVDQSESRNGEEALYVSEGMAEGIQQPLLTMIKVIHHALKREGENNTSLGRSITSMLDELITADSINRKVGWESDFAVIVKNYRRIMQVLAWFPRFAVQETHLVEPAGDALAPFLENFGILLLLNNDFNDLYDVTHKSGDDIGKRVNTFMHSLYHCTEIPEESRAEFKSICEDPEIVRKKKAFIPLDIDDKSKISRALEIGRENVGPVARSIEQTIREHYDTANMYLDQVFTRHLPIYDERNQHYHHLYKISLDALMQRFKLYMKQA